jgi:hypothetical protein
MKKLLVSLLASLAVHATADESAPTADKARIRIAGIFISSFYVWRIETPSCAVPAQKPWLALGCGLIKCRKPTLLGIPLDLDYSNWRTSPRMTEVEIDADKPFAIHFGGRLDTTAGAIGGAGSYVSYPCVYDLKFTPRAGGMYEATIDPRADYRGCFLRLKEIRLTDTGRHERVDMADAEVKACAE